MSDKLLHREKFIRLGGILLLASPFFNFALTVAMSKGVLAHYGTHGLWLIAKNISIVNWVLYASSVVIGAMMIKGRRSSWAFVLIVLGVYIMRNALMFSHDTRNGGYLQPILAMIINIAIFALVYIQEFHQQVYGFPAERPLAPPAPAPAPDHPVAAPAHVRPIEPVQAPALPPTRTFAFDLKPPQPKSALPAIIEPARGKSYSFRLPMPVDFQGFGHWALVTSISEKEIRMRSLNGYFPKGLETRAVELQLPTQPSPVVLRARLSNRTDNEYVFAILNGRFRAAA